LDHWIHASSFLFLAELDSAIAGLEEAKNLAGKLLRLIQIGLATPTLAKISPTRQENPTASADYGFKFQKRSQLFLRVHNETLSVIAMCVGNKDCSPAGIHCCDAAPAPPSFAEIVSDDFPVLEGARPEGLEPSTYGLEIRCSIRLSYGRRIRKDIYRVSLRIKATQAMRFLLLLFGNKH
jgi:hypothetical protein